MKEDSNKYIEKRYLVIYGYTRQELSKVIRHFKSQLPDNVKITSETDGRITKIILTGSDTGLEYLRFQMNKFQQNLSDIFRQDLIATDDISISRLLGELLKERELTISTAESCTGGAVAHKIVETPGSSNYFMGGVVSYSNDAKADILKVPRRLINKYGAVSQEVVEAMATGACKIMHSSCSIATSGIAGPDGGTKYKPVGTVWIAVKIRDRVVSECVKFDGNRHDVMQAAGNHGIVMLINLLRNTYVMQEDFNDE